MQSNDRIDSQRPDNLSVAHFRKAVPLSRRSLIAAGFIAAVGALYAPIPNAIAETSIKLPIIDDITQQVDTLNRTASALTEACKTADYNQALVLANELSEEIIALREALNGTLVNVAETITPYKNDIRAARNLLDVARIVIDTMAIPIIGLLTQDNTDLVSYLPEDGGMQLNLSPIRTILDTVAHAIPELRSPFTAVVEIEGDLHIQQLADLVDPLRINGSTYLQYLDIAERLLPLVPAILGAGGPRTYLVVAQTNSEIAATGGFPGAMGYASLDNGRFEMGEFDSVFRTIPRQEYAPLPLTDEEVALYGDAVGWATDVMGHNPDFPRAAELWAQANQQANGFGVSGVVALDPVFLQSMIQLTDAVIPMDDGTYLDGNNTAEMLLNTVYWNYLGSSSSQDAYFSEAAAKAADTIFSNAESIDAFALLDTLSRAFSERRLNLWLADPAEEEALVALGLDNGVAGSADRPELGVFLSDEIWSKMEWYLEMAISLGPEGELDGCRAVPTSVALTNTITYEEAWAAGGNAYIVGYNEDVKREDGDMGVSFCLYAPVGGNILNFSCEAAPSGYTPEVSVLPHKGRWVVKGLAKMLPGETLTLHFDTVLPQGCDAPLEVDSTPLGRGTVVTRE